MTDVVALSFMGRGNFVHTSEALHLPGAASIFYLK